MNEEVIAPETQPTNKEAFLAEVLEGLGGEPKRLSSKYFYDAKGDRIFQQIMSCPEYYLTRCEDEIIRAHAGALTALFLKEGPVLDVVELGAGDASKSTHLLRSIIGAGADATYYPIDISENVIRQLEAHLPVAIPGLKMKGLNGEYIPMLKACYERSPRRKAILFMGANIGNMPPDEAGQFCIALHDAMRKGDYLMIGVDLKKSPEKILAAYNDAGGFTRDFNLNLLHRINRELGADFNVADYYHYPVYDPDTGTCKSYLVSRKPQQVSLSAAGKSFSFSEGETIHTEVSHKYTTDQVAQLAAETGFKPVQDFMDDAQGFLVTVWVR